MPPPHDSPAAADGDNLPRILPVLDLLTEEELTHLNHLVVQRLRLMEDIRAHGQMQDLRLGQRVRFTAPDGQTIHGTLARHNRKSVTAITATGAHWRVAPAFLQPD